MSAIIVIVFVCYLLLLLLLLCSFFSTMYTLSSPFGAQKAQSCCVFFFIFCTFSFVSTRLKYFCIPRVIYNFCLSFECAYMNMYILVRRFLCGFVWFVSLANQCKSFHSSTMSDWLFQCRRWVIINVVVVVAMNVFFFLSPSP